MVLWYLNELESFHPAFSALCSRSHPIPSRPGNGRVESHSLLQRQSVFPCLLKMLVCKFVAVVQAKKDVIFQQLIIVPLFSC